MMLDQRKDSANRARDASHFIPPGGFNYAIQRNFPPGLWQGDIWHQLCDIFSTEEFAKKCEKGKKNRSSTDSSGVTSRHTGGSIGYDEHRNRLEKKLGREVTMKELFLHTHLTKESKRLYLAGQYDESSEEMEFCTGRSKEVFESYSKNLIQKYGCDETQHPLGDIDVWQSRAGEGRELYGIGSSDPHFVVTGTHSSSSLSGPSHAEFQRSQQEFERCVNEQVERQVNEQVQRQVAEMERRMQEELQRKVDLLLSKLGNNPGIPPP